MTNALPTLPVLVLIFLLIVALEVVLEIRRARRQRRWTDMLFRHRTEVIELAVEMADLPSKRDKLLTLAKRQADEMQAFVGLETQ